MWVFGYGSLLWKIEFPYEEKLVGYVKGYVRRFYQYSIDHRGTPEKPGRVVTVIPSDENSSVWGVAYRINKEDIEKVTKYLDYREKNGYSQVLCTFHPLDENRAPFELKLYVATVDNVSFAGPASIETIAKQIVECNGPSGPNIEYLYNLAKAMRDIAPGVEDDHLFALEKAVKELDKESKT